MAPSEHVVRVSTGHTDGQWRFATLREAVEAARRMREPSAACRIVVEGGTHFVDAPVCLDARDSGLIIEGAAGESATLCGGRRVEGWRPDGDRFWAADVPDVKDGSWDFRVLIVNGRWRARARLPERGYFYHTNDADPAPLWQSDRVPPPDYADYTTLACGPDDIEPGFDASNAEVRVYHSWDESLVRVAALDADTHVMTLYPPCVYPPGTFGHREYVIWNTREGMTQPGQWRLDRGTGKVIYWPLPGETLDAFEAVAPVLESILQIHGSADEAVRDVVVRNLAFTATRSCLTNEKLLEMVAPSTTELAASIGVGGRNSEGALSLRHADACTLVDLTFRQIGGQAVKGRHLRNPRLIGCDISEVGAAGVHLDHVDGADIANNRVHAVGRLFPSANAVLVTQAENTAIRHNDICDTPYSGINLHTCRHTSICSNRIRRAMQEIDDGAGIYVAYGEYTLVRGNQVSDLTDSTRCKQNLRHAYYFDIGCMHCVLERNLAARCSSFSHIHMAAQVIVRDNIFISDRSGAISFRRSADCLFERNVVQVEDDLEVYDAELQAVRRNVLFTRNGRIVAFSTHDPGAPERALQAEPNNVRTDPAVVEEREGCYRVSSQELADALDLGPINVAAAGIVDSPQLFTLREDARDAGRRLYPVLVEGMRRARDDGAP